MVNALRGKIMIDPHSLPKIEFYSRIYLGEYAWHPEVSEVDKWDTGNGGPYPVQCRPTVASYTCERGNYDYSIDQTISIEIPAGWLSSAMGLRLANGRTPIYVDRSGKEMFFDPSVISSGPAAALIDRDAFLEMLDREDLSAIWVIAGEKGAYGGSDLHLKFGGRLRHTAVYHLRNNNFIRYFHKEWQRASEDQLQEFFDQQPATPTKRSRVRSTTATKPLGKKTGRKGKRADTA